MNGLLQSKLDDKDNLFKSTACVRKSEVITVDFLKLELNIF